MRENTSKDKPLTDYTSAANVVYLVKEYSVSTRRRSEQNIDVFVFSLPQNR